MLQHPIIHAQVSVMIDWWATNHITGIGFDLKNVAAMRHIPTRLVLISTEDQI